MSARQWEDAAAELVATAAEPGLPASWLGTLLDGPVAATLDHTLLRPEATGDDILRLAREGRDLRTATICVNGAWVHAAALAGGVGVAAVIGFPLGAMHAAAKAMEARRAIEDGATELDMVQPLGRVLAGEWQAVHDDVRAVVEAAGAVPVKVILESAVLTPLATATSALVAAAAGAAFVKTSTGFHAAGGASLAAVGLMRRAVGLRVGVKASGGIRSLAQALAMLRAGANRIGTSGAAAIVEAGGSSDLATLLASLGAASPTQDAGPAGYG